MVAAYIVLERHLRVPYGNPQEAVRERGRVTKKKKGGERQKQKKKNWVWHGFIESSRPIPSVIPSSIRRNTI